MARRKDVYDKIRQITTKYLLRNIGELAVTGWPRYDEDRKLWVVTVLCETPRGVIPAGRIELDKKLNLIYASTREDMVAAVEENLRRKLFLVMGDEAELRAKGVDIITA
ncbi:MAG: hypothetical protein AAB354_06755 [candidate division KSB1 bacterium]